MPFLEKLFTGGEIPLNYIQGPASGPALLLLHGGSARWQSWESILPALSTHWQVFAPDLRGHGKSGRAACYRLQDYASDTAVFLTQVVQKPAYLFGHSLGGMIALYAAAQFPDTVRAVIAGDSSLTRDTLRAGIEGSRSRLSAWAEIAGGGLPLSEMIHQLKSFPMEVAGQIEPSTMSIVWGEDHPVFQWLAENLSENDPAMLRALLNDFDAVTENYHMHTLLPQIRCPVLLLQADPNAGGVMGDVEVARAVQLLIQPFVTRLNGVSHVFHNENPQAVIEAVEQFLDQVDREKL